MSEIKASDFKPLVKGRSDFYSWQLYRWLRKNPEYTTIWRGTWNAISGVDGSSCLYIGGERDNTGFISARLLRNLCLAGENLQLWAYGKCHDTANWEDVSDWFWRRYKTIGVCAIHEDYAHNWRYDNPHNRTCLYCGKREMAEQILKPILVWGAS